MTNIYEVAKKAGVSHMTVSRVFNHPDQVNTKTREKVLKIANELGYRPNLIARSMRTKRTHYLGLILPDIVNPFFPEIVRGVDDCARKNNYNIILVNTDNDYEVQTSSLEMFVDKNVDGIILSGIAGGKRDREFITKVMERNIPTILIDRFIPDLDSSYVITNNFKAGYDATNYLIKLGHKRIGVVSSPQKIRIFQDRLKGYKQALLENDIEFREEFVSESEESIQGGYMAINRLLATVKDLTAIFAMCDFIAFGIYKYCKERNIKIPDDLSIISIDDIYPSALITPPLTTIAQQKYEIGFKAAKILIDSIKKGTLPKKQIVLEAKLVERESCRKID